uniref:Phosphatidylserine synthase n=1 Tax=Meloidogyne incognita TaxID=6306 RepID=A0A914KS95_MELIC
MVAADARGKVSTWASTWAGLKRCIAIYMFIMIWLATELNVFFLKHVFAIDTSHPVVFWHIILICLICAPTIRQYYIYVTDPKVKRMGMQCWLYAVICALEASICIKFGREQLPSVKLWLIGLWIAFLAVGTIFCVWVSIWWTKYQMLTREVEVRGGGIRDCYLDSSCENLGAIQEDVHKRRKKLKICSSNENLVVENNNGGVGVLTRVGVFESGRRLSHFFVLHLYQAGPTESFSDQNSIPDSSFGPGSQPYS